MQPNYLLMAATVICVLFAVTWCSVDAHAFVFLNDTDAKPSFSFYKLSLQWPDSTCTSTMSPGVGLDCGGVVPDQFTIHGLWPQNAHDNSIRPYNPKAPCTGTTSSPTPPGQIMPTLSSIQQELKQLWPNLKNSENDKLNQFFWEREWAKHDMCSDYFNNPLGYFKDALELRKRFNPVLNLQPGENYTVQEVANAIRTQLGAKPEIACSTSRVENNTLLLWEVRLCFNRQTYPKAESIQDCQNDFSRDCRNLSDRVKIPKPVTPPPASTTDEMSNHPTATR